MTKALFNNKVTALALAVFMATGTPDSAQAQSFSGSSPLPSEDQLMALGCRGPFNRDFQRGTMLYGCSPYAVQNMQPSGPGDGVRCDVIGRTRDEYIFECAENVTDYDQDYGYARRGRAPVQPYYNDPYAGYGQQQRPPVYVDPGQRAFERGFNQGLRTNRDANRPNNDRPNNDRRGHGSDRPRGPQFNR